MASKTRSHGQIALSRDNGRAIRKPPLTTSISKRLSGQVKELWKKSRKLGRQKRTLEQKVSRLERANAELTRQRDAAIGSNTDLRERNHELAEENRRIRDEVAALAAGGSGTIDPAVREAGQAFSELMEQAPPKDEPGNGDRRGTSFAVAFDREQAEAVRASAPKLPRVVKPLQFDEIGMSPLALVSVPADSESARAAGAKPGDVIEVASTVPGTTTYYRVADSITVASGTRVTPELRTTPVGQFEEDMAAENARPGDA